LPSSRSNTGTRSKIPLGGTPFHSVKSSGVRCGSPDEGSDAQPARTAEVAAELARSGSEGGAQG
jgi:hypothetical protein